MVDSQAIVHATDPAGVHVVKTDSRRRIDAIAKVIETLSFYADADHYVAGHVLQLRSVIQQDGGVRAREALELLTRWAPQASSFRARSRRLAAAAAFLSDLVGKKPLSNGPTAGQAGDACGGPHGSGKQEPGKEPRGSSPLAKSAKESSAFEAGEDVKGECDIGTATPSYALKLKTDDDDAWYIALEHGRLNIRYGEQPPLISASPHDVRVFGEVTRDPARLYTAFARFFDYMSDLPGARDRERIVEERDRALRLLRKHRWEEIDLGGVPSLFCVECNRNRTVGCRHDCEAAILIGDRRDER
jgi:hypothetical protein